MRTLAVLIPALFVLVVLAAPGGSSIAAFAPAPMAKATYASGAALPAAPPTAPASNLGPLPSSVMPHTDAQCSVLDLGGGSSQCSVFPGAAPPRRCSAHCDSNQDCSVLASSGTTQYRACSVLGERKGSCSVLQQPAGGVGGSFCSAEAGQISGNRFCSVMQEASNKWQGCSAENPGAGANFCSAMQPGLLQGVPVCSVLGGGTVNKSYCSTARSGGAKECSSITDQLGFGSADCSILIGNRGACTNLKGAPSGSCSMQFGAGAACSVIPLSNGTFCQQP